MNVIRIITAWTPYSSCSSSRSPGGSVCRYRLRNCSKTKMNAFAITSMNEYWMNALSQPQKSHSSVGTMKNGTKSGPDEAAHAARDHAERDDEQQRELRQPDDEQHRPVEQIARRTMK